MNWLDAIFARPDHPDCGIGVQIFPVPRRLGPKIHSSWIYLIEGNLTFLPQGLNLADPHHPARPPHIVPATYSNPQHLLVAEGAEGPEGDLIPNPLFQSVLVYPTPSGDYQISFNSNPMETFTALPGSYVPDMTPPPNPVPIGGGGTLSGVSPNGWSYLVFMSPR